VASSAAPGAAKERPEEPSVGGEMPPPNPGALMVARLRPPQDSLDIDWHLDGGMDCKRTGCVTTDGTKPSGVPRGLCGDDGGCRCMTAMPSAHAGDGSARLGARTILHDLAKTSPHILRRPMSGEDADIAKLRAPGGVGLLLLARRDGALTSCALAREAEAAVPTEPCSCLAK